MTSTLNHQNKTNVLLIERAQGSFTQYKNTGQRSGLSNCISHIADSVYGISHVVINDDSNVMAAVNRLRPRKVVFEALWAGAGLISDLRRLMPDLEMFVHLHSNIPFLTEEAGALNMLGVYKKHGVRVIWNSTNAFDAMRNFVDGVYLPNVYPLNFMDATKKESDEFLDVGCFGSLRPMKNQLIQAIAAINYAETIGKTLRFHLNFGRSDNGSSVKASIKGLFALNSKHQKVDVPWLSHAEFIEYCRKLDLGLQVSMSETFNLVSADYVAAGIPMVVSTEIFWADAMSKVGCSSSRHIEYAMAEALADPLIIERNRSNLSAHVNDAIERWVRFSEA